MSNLNNAFIIGAILLSISRVGQEISQPIAMAWTHEEIRSDRYRATIESLIEASAGFVIVMVAVPLLLLIQEKIQFLTIDKFTLLKIVTFVLSCAIIFVNIPLAWFITRGQRSSSGKK